MTTMINSLPRHKEAMGCCFNSSVVFIFLAERGQRAEFEKNIYERADYIVTSLGGDL